jgi:serine/threonine protein kinase/tetratricopeptide (TPR) repeat protein
MASDTADFDSLFCRAIEIASASERAAFIARVSGSDDELRLRLERLVAAHFKAGNFLESSSATATEEPRAGETEGRLIGPYKLIQPIGEGGMGTVFMAQQAEPIKRLVALKLIKPGMDSRQVIARFEAERQALALMEHPNIAKVLDAGTTQEGRPYFVMELVRGVPITKHCDDNRLTPRQRLELFIPVCQAVQHAHQKGIIHRDLKPGNVLVAPYDGKPVPKVIDFGVAKAMGQQLTDHTLVTGFGTVVGTLEYMSPEQAELNQLDIDTRSDIYALGVMLYELLTGTTPLDRKRLTEAAFTEMLRMIREVDPPKPSTRLSESKDSLPSVSAQRQMEPARLTRIVRGELDWIVMKALEKDRNRRYDTANGFAMDLQRYLADEPVQACPPSAMYRFRKFARRNKGPLLAAGVVLICLLTGIIGTTTGLVWAVRERNAKARALSAEIKEREAKEKALSAEIKEREAKEKALAAETRALKAEQQAREKAMDALRAMTDDIVENQMARASHLTEENKEFLRKIVKHFEGFAALTSDDAESRSIRAEGYFHVGLMRHRLGELKEAEAAYADALAIRKQLAADFPRRPEFRSGLAKCRINLGALFWKTGRLKEAEASFTDAMAIQKQLAADFPSRPEYRYGLASSHTNLGGMSLQTGRLKEAEASYTSALAIEKQLAAEFPTRPDFRSSLAMSHGNLGTFFRETGRQNEAESSYTSALAIQKQLAADFPMRPEFRFGVAKSHFELAGLFNQMGRLKEAEASYTSALAIQKQLAAEFPTRPDFRSYVAKCQWSLGNLFSDAGRLKEAEPYYTDALVILKQLAADFPARPEFRCDLAGVHMGLGNVLKDTGRLKEAEAAYANALVILKQLVARYPDQPDLRNGLAGTCVDLALLHTKTRSFEAAKAYLDEAAPHHEAALKANPGSPTYRRFYRNGLQTLIPIDAGMGDWAGALAVAKKLRDFGWDPPSDAYDAGGTLALCIPIVQMCDRMTKEARDKLVQFYGDAAMTMLREAVARGFKDAGLMRTDSALDSLRKRVDFHKLVEEVAKKR